MQISDSFCLSCKVLKCFLLVILDFWRGVASFKFHHWTTFHQIQGPCIQTKVRFEDFQQFGLKTISFKRTICNQILQLSRWSLNSNAIIILFIYFPSLPQLGTQLVGQAFHLLECSVTQFFEVKIDMVVCQIYSKHLWNRCPIVCVWNCPKCIFKFSNWFVHLCQEKFAIMI